jgi:hypothetical protein
MAKTTTKKKTTTRKKRVTKKKRSTTLNLMVRNEESSCGLETVQLDVKHRTAFRERFGILNIPTLEEFNSWKETL